MVSILTQEKSRMQVIPMLKSSSSYATIFKKENSERKEEPKVMNSKKVALYGILISLAFIFSYIESLFPVHLMVPGVKLGLANLVSVVGLYTIGASGTICISLIRIVLSSLLFGAGFSSMIYGLSGGMLSLAVMIFCKKYRLFSHIGVSILGGAAHNLGQLIAAAIVLNSSVFVYFPALLIAGTAAGACIGILGGIITARIGKYVTKL